MLSMDDRRRLAEIETQLELADPEFVRAFTAGRPRRPSGDRRWPLGAALCLAGAAFFAGLFAQIAALVLVGAALAVGATFALWLHARRVQGRPVRRQRRTGRPPDASA